MKILLFLFITALAHGCILHGCPFCDPKVIDSQLVLEGDHFYLLCDFQPRVEGHLLVVTKRHLAKAHELSSEEWKEFGTLLPKIVQVFSTHLGTDQYLLIEKNGRNAFQQIPHVHFHLLPIQNQTVEHFFGAKPRRLTAEELEQAVTTFWELFHAHSLHSPR